jgi:hypothetical protein
MNTSMNKAEFLRTFDGELTTIKMSDPLYAGDVPGITRGLLKEVFGHVHKLPVFKRMREQIEVLEAQIAELEFELRVQRRVEELGTKQAPAQRQELAAKIRAKVAG